MLSYLGGEFAGLPARQVTSYVHCGLSYSTEDDFACSVATIIVSQLPVGV